MLGFHKSEYNGLFLPVTIVTILRNRSMNRYQAIIRWQHSGGDFTGNKYSRKHTWHFDEELEIPASASPHIVPKPYTDLSAIDPEEAFVASLSSCHMLWFLSLTAQEGCIVKQYEDRAEGIMQKNNEGKLAITEVILRPVVTFGQESNPDQHLFEKLHHTAHKRCFIAHSVKTEITIDPKFDVE